MTQTDTKGDRAMLTYNGGPAFPMTMRVTADAVDGKTTVNEVATMGMSLRDYFAAKAMSGMVANPTTVFTKDIDECNRIVCEMAYTIADAMLAAREVKP